MAYRHKMPVKNTSVNCHRRFRSETGERRQPLGQWTS